VAEELCKLYGLSLNGSGTSPKPDPGQIVSPIPPEALDGRKLPSPRPLLPKSLRERIKGDPIFYAYRDAACEYLMFIGAHEFK
jgi:hypothetical protein